MARTTKKENNAPVEEPIVATEGTQVENPVEEQVQEQEQAPEESQQQEKPLEGKEPQAPAKPQPSAPAAPVAQVSGKVRMVKIHTTEAIETFIGGTRYDFKSDREVAVPSDVAAILCNSRKAFRV